MPLHNRGSVLIVFRMAPLSGTRKADKAVGTALKRHPL